MSSAFRSISAFQASSTHQEDFMLPYVRDLKNVVDIDAIRDAKLKLAVDPLGGAARDYWEPINCALWTGHRRSQSDH